MNTKATALAVGLLRQLGIDPMANATVTLDCCEGLIAVDVNVAHEPVDLREMSDLGLTMEDIDPEASEVLRKFGLPPGKCAME
jgi:hypothetical protein